MLDQLSHTLETIHTHLVDPERLPVAMAAIVLSAIIGMITGPLAGNANPLLWFGYDRILGNFGDRLDNPQRGRADLMFRGFLVMALALFLAVLLWKGLQIVALEAPQYRLVEILSLSLLISVGTVWFALLRLYFAMEQDKVGDGSFYAIARSTRTNLSAGDDFGITRAAMNFTPRSLDKALITPVFWYFIIGLPGAVIYAALAGLAWRFNKDGFSAGFGAVPAALERLLGFVPALYTAALITLASVFTPSAKPFKAVSAWLDAKNRSPYEQGGVPLSAMAWGLNVSLGGASQDLNGSAIKAVWTGPDGASAKLGHRHLRRALVIHVIATLLFLASLAGAYVWGRSSLDFMSIISPFIERLTF